MALSYKAELDLVQRSFEAQSGMIEEKSLKKWQERICTDLSMIRAATEGGEAALKLLSQGAAENPDEFRNRQKRFRNINLCGFGAAAHAWLLMGNGGATSSYWLRDQPIPDMINQILEALDSKDVGGFEKSQAINQWFRDVKEANNWNQLSVMAAFLRMRDGLSAVKAWPRYEEDFANARAGQINDVGLGLLRIEDAYPVYHFEDPTTLVAVAEARRYGAGLDQYTRWRLWTGRRWDWIDDSFEIVEAGEEHAFGRPPFAFLGNGESILKNAVLDQRELIHRESIRLVITNSQGFSYLQVNGIPLNKDGNESGNQYSGQAGSVAEVGTDRMWWFKDEMGQINFVSPNAPLEEHRKAAQELMVNSFRVSLMLPGDLVSDSGMAEQPTTIQWHWLISKIAYSGFVQEGIVFEDDLTRVLAPVAGSGKIPDVPAFDPEDLDWDHRFRESPIPQEESAERDADRQDVGRGLMHEAHYIAKHVMKDAEPKTVVRYWQAIQQTKQDRLQNALGQNGNSGNPFQMPPRFAMTPQQRAQLGNGS